MAKTTDKAATTEVTTEEEEVLDTIFTIPNLISAIRLCMVPCFIVLLLNGFDIPATILFALAASTDWIDGQVARRTHTVSKLGRLLDPAVDRILMISGVVCLLIVGRLPLWVVLFVIVRDLLLLIGGAWLIKKWRIRVAVIYPGKVATTFLFVGFAALLLNWPVLDGLGVVNAAWLPGLSPYPYSWGIWFVYVGLVIALFTTLYYVIAAAKRLAAAKHEAAKAGENGGAR